MIDEQLQEQASLYVLGALDPAETGAFEAQLAANSELREHVRALSDVAASLAHIAPPRPLPPHLEGRIMAAIRAETPAGRITPLRMNWIPWAAAACLAVACAVAFSQRARLADQLAAVQTEIANARDKVAAAESKAAAAEAQVASLAREKDRAEQQVVELERREADARTQMATLAAARDEAVEKLARTEEREQRDERIAREEGQQRDDDRQPTGQPEIPRDDQQRDDAFADVQVATLTSKMSKAPNATAAIVWDAARQRGVLNSSNIPPNSADRDYQLWIVDTRFADPIDAGVFHVEKAGSARFVFKPKIRIEAPVGFAVSVERRGGVPKAQGPIVLAGK